MFDPTVKVPIYINAVEATFLFRALKSYKVKINEVLDSAETLTPLLQNDYKDMKAVAMHQDDATGSLMELLNDGFNIDDKYLAPNF